MYQIDSLSRIPVYEQIVEQTKRFILSGVLCPGAQMASVRGIAFEHTFDFAKLGITPAPVSIKRAKP